MKARMPKGKIISLILKYLVIYLIVCAGINCMGSAAIVNLFAEHENTMRVDMFRSFVDSAQTYLTENEVSLTGKKMIPEFYYLTTWSTNLMAIDPVDSNGDSRNSTVRTYGFVKDRETGEMITDSIENVFLTLRFQDDIKANEIRGFNLEKNFVILYCPFRQFEESYTSARGTQEGALTGTMGKLIREKTTLSELLDPSNGLDFKPEDIWRKEDGTFLPGKILITWKDQRNEESISLDFTPANTDGYFHLENLEHMGRPQTEEGISGSYLFASIMINRITQDQAFQEEAKNRILQLGKSELSTNIQNKKILGVIDEIEIAICGTVTAKDGKAYTIYQYLQINDYSRGIMKMFQFMFFIGYEVLLVIFLVAWCFSYNRKKYQYESEAYRKMLVNVMAHDLKTPLTATGGYAESLKEHLHTDKMELYAGEIEKNVHYMNEIISENLALSQYEYERRKLQKKTVDLVECCKESIQRFQGKAEEKKLLFSVEGQTSIRGDKELLQRAFDNLIINAVKYSEPESVIKIIGEKRRIRIQNKSAQKLEGNLKRLWEPFVRGNESRSGEKGTGIGLYVVAKILKDHQWKYRLRYDEKSAIFECEIKIPWGILF